jgi:hypothetical protein
MQATEQTLSQFETNTTAIPELGKVKPHNTSIQANVLCQAEFGDLCRSWLKSEKQHFLCFANPHQLSVDLQLSPRASKMNLLWLWIKKTSHPVSEMLTAR